ncbi:Putative nuclease HARBI1 [Eumeta japonica]|uniref:Nuclease HARBI1 n=1 Tax=Eumeta variegata TaxID=151549 RepID=A0A4C1TEU2_EUMVA|nr:Putative nuclease HARBI1 [Eumeta japonica]
MHPEAYISSAKKEKKEKDLGCYRINLTLLSQVESAIQKQDTHMRNAIPAKVKLEVTLRYLATGDSLHTLEALYRVGRSTISIFLPEVCEAIYSALKDYIRIPSREDWIRIEHGFRTKWNFPGCVGALDGKHINIFAPDDTSDYYNYKGANSIILLALVDDEYCFSYINVGTNGRASDGGVYQKSNLAQAMENNTLNLPDQSVIVANAAFPLKTYLMKPYQTTPTRREKIFNYRLSRARRIVENAFGILVTRFRVLINAIDMTPKKIDPITLAACTLHNWLRKTSDMYITQRSVDFEDIQQGVVVPGAWRAQMRQVLEGLPLTRYNNHASRRAEAIRNTYAQLFETTEAVPWQGHMI